MKRFVVVRTQQEGFHCWPQAPDKVAFLRNLHRHIFKVEVQLPVTHNDRELEYFLVQRSLNKDLEAAMKQLANSASCELIAETLGTRLIKRYELPITITVSEDGENGSIVEFDQNDVAKILSRQTKDY